MSNELALIKKDVVDVVASKVNAFVQNNELHLPANYSPENAMKSAWLILQETVDRDKKPALTVCTRDSVANALLDMCVQGLNPAKKQGYFIVYGKKLQFQRSYFGTMAVTKQVADAKDIWAQVVWEGDEFEYEIKGSKKYITLHKQKIENVGKKILAAYCTIEFNDGSEYTDIMTFEQIKKAWAKSKMNPDNATSTHNEYSEEMARKTVINRTCKKYINSSNDGNLFIQHFNRADDEITEDEIEQEVLENANSEVIDVELQIIDESEAEPKPATAPEPEPPKEKPKKAKQDEPGLGPDF